MTAVALLTIVSLGGESVAAEEKPKAEPTAKAAQEKAAPAKPKPISLDDYLTGVSKPGISASDQAAFAKQHAGADVTWTGYVRTVNKNLSPDGTLYMLILKARLADEEGKPGGFFFARFTGAAEKQLLALESEQKVTVSGTLEVGQNPAIPILADAKISGS
jgi:hypothetical protein